MCGLAGIVGFGFQKEFEQLISAISHRGPDAFGTFGDDSVRLGMHRLKFRGGDCGMPLPVSDELVAYNGQVYGHRTVSGQFVPHAGDLLAEVQTARDQPTADGMFAQASYSLGKRRVLLATDPHFIKPLFTRRLSGGVAFASELSPLLALSRSNKINSQALSELFAFGWYLSEQTVAADVELVWKRDVVASVNGIERIPKRAMFPAVQDSANAESLRHAIRSSVGQAIEGAGPLGLAFSGGLDSTILAFELNELGVRDLVCITVATPGETYPTLAELSLTGGEAWRTWKHIVVHVDETQLAVDFESAVVLFGQPTTMSSLPLYLRIADAARDAGVRAILLGEGVDEYFAGYGSYAKVQSLSSILDYYSHPVREHLVATLFGQERQLELRREFSQVYGSVTDLRVVERDMRLARLLLRSDVMLMSRSIEGRVPFLHRNIPGIALTLPWEELARLPGKTLLRDAFSVSLGEIATKAKSRFKASDCMLLKAVEVGRWEARIMASCSGIFGEAAVRSVLADLRNPELFDADILCLLGSLAILLERGALQP